MDADLIRIQAEKLEKKMRKKMKNSQAAQTETPKALDASAPALKVNGAEPQKSAQPDAGAEPKKKKKRKQQAEDPITGGPAEAGMKKKNKTKQQLGGTAAAISTANGQQAGMNPGTAADEGLEPKKKKNKSKASVPETRASLAAVGDQELARTGKPIQKALYTEDPAVMRMTDAEVQQWRDERETAVAGCDIKPVTAFDQAGERSMKMHFKTLL